MAIMISKKGDNLKKVDKSPFEQEERLQEYVYQKPDILPLYELKEDIRLLILAKELPADSGSMDAFGTDKDGDIYIIETKLYKNSDKRQVIAQVLDYGAALWKTGEFSQLMERINAKVQDEFDISANQRIKEFFDINEEELAFLLDNVKRNLDDGLFKFVVLMDTVSQQLKDLIMFMNQNTRFDIYAVELEYYSHDNYEIFIPKLFGSEVKKDIDTGRVKGRIWDEKTFFEAIKNKISDKEVLSIVKELYDFTQKEGASSPWSRQRTKYGTFNFYFLRDGQTRSLFFVSGQEYLWLYLYELEGMRQFRQDLISMGINIEEKASQKGVDLEDLKEIGLDKFKTAVQKLVRTT